MYHTLTVLISSGMVYEWCENISRKANNLYNAALFRERQSMTSRNKSIDQLTDNELEVLNEIEVMNRILGEYNKPVRNISPSGYLSYAFLDDLMKYNNNPDYKCSGLPRQTAQHILKQVCQDIKSFFEAMKAYKQTPWLFAGKPELPHYKRKQGICSFIVSNQDCVIRKNKKERFFAKLPLTKAVVPLGKEVPGILKEVHVTPANGRYQISFVFDDEAKVPKLMTEEPKRIASIDFGVDNFMAVANNCGLPCLLYKGGVIKSANQLYNKKIADIMSRETKGSDEKFKSTAESQAVTQRRNNIVSDFMLQTGKHFITWCVENRIDTIVIGDNPFWKQKANIGHQNNQRFVQIPFDRMKTILTWQAERHGIRVLRQEESYTSKANFLGNDVIPVYGKNDGSAKFTGKRVHRGLYQTNDGITINADINGSANILRKGVPNAFKNNDLLYQKIVVIKHPMYYAMIRNRLRQKTSNPG